ncbi:MAG: type II secretion system protein [bacterium]|nr:type II secretion system protein [bacterium]
MQYKKNRIQNTEYRIRNTSRAFTLVEIIVSVGLFAVVMLISVGALLSLTGANRKAQALQSVMNNLNIALDGMVRSIRMGSDYHCRAGSFIGDGSDDCAIAGGTVFSFEALDGDRSTTADQWFYSYDSVKETIYRSINGDNTRVALMSPEIQIKKMKFYVVGSAPGDTDQPKVVIAIEGVAGAASVKTKTTFNIQATAVQRVLDL